MASPIRTRRHPSKLSRTSIAANLIVFLCSALWVEAEWQDGLLFHASFDQGVTADFAKGKPEPATNGNPRLAEGVRGKVLLVGDSSVTGLAYENDANFSITQGTVAFWLQPIDWLGNRGKAKFFNLFMQGAGSGAGYFGLEMERFNQPEPVLIFYSLNFSNRRNMHIPCAGSGHWLNHAWHHVALTWNSREGRLFVDGEFVGSDRLTEPFQSSDLHSQTFTIGGSGEEHTALDELRLWNRPLNASEIGELYRKEKR